MFLPHFFLEFFKNTCIIIIDFLLHLLTEFFWEHVYYNYRFSATFIYWFLLKTRVLWLWIFCRIFLLSSIKNTCILIIDFLLHVFFFSSFVNTCFVIIENPPHFLLSSPENTCYDWLTYYLDHSNCSHCINMQNKVAHY